MFASHWFPGAAEAASALASVTAGDGSRMWIGVAVFAAAWLFIISGKVDKTAVAVLGAGLMAVLGVAGFSGLPGKIEFNVLGLLIGMMIIVNILASTGVFEYLAVKIARQAGGHGILVVSAFLAVTALLSAFAGNVTAVLLMAPVTILIAQLLRLPAVPILIGEAVFANIGGGATLIGSRTNIIIGAESGLSFNAFLLNLGPIMLVVAAATLGCVLFAMRRNFGIARGTVARIRLTEPRLAILDPARLSRSLWVCGLVLLGFFAGPAIGLEPGLVAVCGALIMTLVCRIELPRMLEKVEWDTVLFLCGLFMMVGALEADGVFSRLGPRLVDLSGGSLGATLMIVLWGSALLAAVLDSIPLVIATVPLLHAAVPVLAEKTGMGVELVAEPLFWALALGACLGSSGTLIGGGATPAVCRIARKNGYLIRFRQFTRYGLPLTVFSLGLCSVYLFLRYIP